jgi:hypothetical protein
LERQALLSSDPGVTDSVIAVLSNNWNRAVGQTLAQDPAATSLLTAVVASSCF